MLFIDDGYTGTNMERPALQEIMGAITDFNTGKSHIRINSLVVARIDRLGRSLLGTLQFIQDYIVAAKDSKNSAVNRNREDINFVSVAENYCRIDKDNPQGKFLLMLFATLAEFDRDQIVEKLKRGRQARVASGKWMGGGNAPFGYRYNKETSSLEVVPEEAEVVREIFRLYIEEKMPPQKIAERFDLPPVHRRKDAAAEDRGALSFQRRPGDPPDPDAQVPYRLHHLQRRGIRGQPRGHHLPGYLAGGPGGAAAAQRQPNGLQLSALGPGILRRMRREDALPENKGHKLVCYSSQESSNARFGKADSCDSERFWCKDVEQAVIDELFRLKYLGQPDTRKTENSVDNIAVLQKELAAARKRLSRLYDFEDEDETDDVLSEKILDARQRVRNIEAQIREEERYSTIERKKQKIKGILRTLQSTWPEMNDVQRQSTCQQLIDRVIIYKDGSIDVKLQLRKYLKDAEIEQ